MEPTILHADLDAFSASVEQLLDPSLRGKPIAGGGGGVLAASYEAKAFGVRGGMPGRQACELCPHLIFVGGHFSEYQRLGDAAIKQISASFVLWQIFVLRSVITIPVLIAILTLRKVSLKPRHLGWTAVRSLLLTMLWVAYYAALTHLALGMAAATYYTLPIFITLFAALFLGDKIRPLGWNAVLLGFAGVLLILKPQADGFSAYALLPLLSAVF